MIAESQFSFAKVHTPTPARIPSAIYAMPNTVFEFRQFYTTTVFFSFPIIFIA